MASIDRQKEMVSPLPLRAAALQQSQRARMFPLACPAHIVCVTIDVIRNHHKKKWREQEETGDSIIGKTPAAEREVCQSGKQK